MAYSNNMQIKSGLTVRYTYTGKPYIVGDQWYVLYKVMRFITKQYSIVGIGSYNDAKNTANSKISQYTKTKKGWYITDNGGQIGVDYENVQYCVAEVTPTHTSGCMWQVDINVNEKDEKWTFNIPTGDLSSLFPAIVPADYDEPTAPSN